MRIAAMLLAEAANHTSDNRVNLLGAGISQYQASQFPALSKLVVFVRVEMMSTEAGQHTLVLNLIDDDGRAVIPPIQGSFQAKAGPPFYAYLNLTFNIEFNVPAPGDYSFRVSLDGHDSGSCPFKVLLAPTTPEQTSEG